jgi:hypothetical protein
MPRKTVRIGDTAVCVLCGQTGHCSAQMAPQRTHPTPGVRLPLCDECKPRVLAQPLADRGLCGWCLLPVVGMTRCGQWHRVITERDACEGCQEARATRVCASEKLCKGAARAVDVWAKRATRPPASARPFSWKAEDGDRVAAGERLRARGCTITHELRPYAPPLPAKVGVKLLHHENTRQNVLSRW